MFELLKITFWTSHCVCAGRFIKVVNLIYWKYRGKIYTDSCIYRKVTLATRTNTALSACFDRNAPLSGFNVSLLQRIVFLYRRTPAWIPHFGVKVGCHKLLPGFTWTALAAAFRSFLLSKLDFSTPTAKPRFIFKVFVWLRSIYGCFNAVSW